MVCHFLKFFGIERTGLSKQPFVDRYFANIVEIAGGAQGRNIICVHAKRIAHSGGIASHPKRMAVNVYVLYIDCGGERLKSVVVEAVKRSHEPQILSDPLS